MITLLPLPLVLKNIEADRDANTRFEWSAFKRFKHSQLIAFGVLGAFYSLIINGANQLENPFLVDRFSIDLETAGYIAMVMGLGTMAGGLIGGNITDQIGQKRSVQAAVFYLLNWSWRITFHFRVVDGLAACVYTRIFVRFLRNYLLRHFHAHD